MATSPQYAATPNVGANPVSATADTSYTAPTHAVTIITAGANGTKVEEIDFVGIGTTVAGVIQLYLYDGTTYHAFYSQVVTVVTPSTTQAPFFAQAYFTNLELKTGWTLVATSFVASQLINVIGFAGDL
jgi:diphthamide biosynthesis methyltransferase